MRRRGKHKHTRYTHPPPIHPSFTYIGGREMGDLHAVDLLLCPHGMVGGVLPHFLLRVELGHVQGVAVGAQLEMHDGAVPVAQWLLFLGDLAGVGGLGDGGCVWWWGGRACVCWGEECVRVRTGGTVTLRKAIISLTRVHTHTFPALGVWT